MYEGILNGLKQNLSFTNGMQITNYNSGYLCDVFNEIADSNIDIYVSDLFEWGKSNYSYIDQANEEFGNSSDIIKQIQLGQYLANEEELYNNQTDILKYYAYYYLNENNIVLNDDELTELEDYITDFDSSNKLEEINDYCNQYTKDIEEIEV